MGESSPDQIYGREFARSSIWARVRQLQYIGESSPDRMYGRAFARGYMGECSPDKTFG